MAKHFAHQILQAVLIRIGADEPRRDLGAIDRLRHHAEGLGDHAEIEAGEVKDFQKPCVGEQPLEVRRVRRARRDLHDIGRTVAGRQLHHAQPIAGEIEPMVSVSMAIAPV